MQKDRRRDLRIPVNRELEALVLEDFSYVRELSPTGVMLATSMDLALGSELRLRFSLLIDEVVVIECTTRVVRTVDAPARGYGLQFVKVDAGNAKLIRQSLAQLRLVQARARGEWVTPEAWQLAGERTDASQLEAARSHQLAEASGQSCGAVVRVLREGPAKKTGATLFDKPAPKQEQNFGEPLTPRPQMLPNRPGPARPTGAAPVSADPRSARPAASMIQRSSSAGRAGSTKLRLGQLPRVQPIASTQRTAAMTSPLGARARSRAGAPVATGVAQAELKSGAHPQTKAVLSTREPSVPQTATAGAKVPPPPPPVGAVPRSRSGGSAGRGAQAPSPSESTRRAAAGPMPSRGEKVEAPPATAQAGRSFVIRSGEQAVGRRQTASVPGRTRAKQGVAVRPAPPPPPPMPSASQVHSRREVDDDEVTRVFHYPGALQG